ncbi:MAG: response regulator transcription factor, partial [bacterium]
VRRAFDAVVQGCLLRRATFEMLEEAIAAVLSGRTYYCPESSRLLIEALRNTSPGEGKTLSPREREILVGLVHGEAPKMLAYRLGLSPKTVNNQLWALKDKLGIHDMAGLVRFAMRCGLAEE